MWTCSKMPRESLCKYTEKVPRYLFPYYSFLVCIIIDDFDAQIYEACSNVQFWWLHCVGGVRGIWHMIWLFAGRRIVMSICITSVFNCWTGKFFNRVTSFVNWRAPLKPQVGNPQYWWSLSMITLVQEVVYLTTRFDKQCVKVPGWSVFNNVNTCVSQIVRVLGLYTFYPHIL